MARTVKLLQLYSATPDDLIYNYYAERFRHQMAQQHPDGSETSVYPIGSINARAIVHETHLRVEILNARHLKPLETQRGQKIENLGPNGSSGGTLNFGNSGAKNRALAACLSAPEESLNFEISNSETFSPGKMGNYSRNDNQMNEVSFSLFCCLKRSTNFDPKCVR